MIIILEDVLFVWGTVCSVFVVVVMIGVFLAWRGDLSLKVESKE